jgi:hypothetical protein
MSTTRKTAQQYHIRQYIYGDEPNNEYVGHGLKTLAEAGKLIRKLEATWDQWDEQGFPETAEVSPAVRYLEGSDFVADDPENNEVGFLLTDGEWDGPTDVGWFV